MKETKLYKSIALFFTRLKPMGWGERIEYIFSYYKEVVFVFVISLAVLSVILYSALIDKSEVIFGGVFANVDINRYGYEYLTDGVMELFDGDPDTQKAALSSTAFESVQELSQLDYAYNAAMKPISMIEEGTLDFLVMDEEAMMFYMTQYALMDLRDVFPEDQLLQMEDLLIYLELETDHSRYPVAIRVNSFAFFRDCVEVEQPVYFSFTGNKEEAESYCIFWQYLMDWKPLEAQ